MNHRTRIFRRLTMMAVFAVFPPLAANAACNDRVDRLAPDSRYVDNGDNTVTDRQTGLMWRQCVEGLTSTASPCDTGAVTLMTWSGALLAVNASNNGGGFAGFTDWRLPNIKELGSLVEYGCFYPAINETLFPGTPATEYYWSSTPDTGQYSLAIDFANGNDVTMTVNTPAIVRMVRDVP